MTESRHVFITPPLDGIPTGGTLYDHRLILALRQAGKRAERLDLATGRREIESGAVGSYWVDSLYLDGLLAFREKKRTSALGLVLHYLPSLVARGDAWTPNDLMPSEHAALHTAEAIVVPSPWLRDVLESTGLPKERVRVVEPGVEVGDGPGSRVASPGGPCSALLVGNVVPGKGVLPFLRALTSCLGEASPRFSFTIVGDLELDGPYAAECRTVVQSSPVLRSAVRFAGSLLHGEALREMRRADVLVSASRMESYGMALSEARAVGVPILARQGGNVRTLVDPAAGGELFRDDAALVSALLRLSADPSELAGRRKLAERSLRRRHWTEAACDFLEPFAFRR